MHAVLGAIPIDSIGPFDIAEYLRVHGETSKVRVNRETALFITIFNHVRAGCASQLGGGLAEVIDRIFPKPRDKVNKSLLQDPDGQRLSYFALRSRLIKQGKQQGGIFSLEI